MNTARSARAAKVVFVLPAHDEAAVIVAFHHALVAATGTRPDLEFEFLYVDDGSGDATLELLLGLRSHDSRVSVVSLSRNHGHQIAVTAGLDLCADADAALVMDTDLQDPPRVAMELIRRWEAGADVAYAQRRTRQDGWFKRRSAQAFYWVLARLSDVDIPRDVGDFRIMDARVVAELRRYREHDRYLRGMVAHVGFRQEAVLFDRDARAAGRSSYTLRSMLRLAASGIFGFTTAPLKLIGRSGAAVLALGVVLAGYVAVHHAAVPGWEVLGAGMLLLAGLQLVLLGVIGSYLARVYVEAQDRPLYSVASCARGERDGVEARRRGAPAVPRALPAGRS